MTLRLPIKLNDDYTCQGRDARGESVVFDDLLREGDEVADHQDELGNLYGPMHPVVRRDDGLWIVEAGAVRSQGPLLTEEDWQSFPTDPETRDTVLDYLAERGYLAVRDDDSEATR